MWDIYDSTLFSSKILTTLWARQKRELSTKTRTQSLMFFWLSIHHWSSTVRDTSSRTSWFRRYVEMMERSYTLTTILPREHFPSPWPITYSRWTATSECETLPHANLSCGKMRRNRLLSVSLATSTFSQKRRLSMKWSKRLSLNWSSLMIISMFSSESERRKKSEKTWVSFSHRDDFRRLLLCASYRFSDEVNSSKSYTVSLRNSMRMTLKRERRCWTSLCDQSSENILA